MPASTLPEAWAGTAVWLSAARRGRPWGGANGGRGGSGGAVLFHANEALNTLAGLRSKVHVKGRPWKNGIGKNKDGSRGEDAVVQVPCGTIVRELYTQ